MKKKVISILLTIVMLVSVIPFGAISAAAEIEVKHGILESSTGGQMIGERDVVYYYSVDSDTTCTATEAKVSGLSIAEGAEVHIVVAKGVTLTCIGGDASGFKGGGAGIEVPQYATLYLEGEGTVIAKGGKAGDGADGVVGEDGKSSDSNYYGGNGGNGGNGGSGAGAGIGTVGSGAGKGGNGGKGDGGEVDKDHLNVTAGEKGSDAQPINPAGTVRTSRTVKLTAEGGAAGKGGSSTVPTGFADKYYQSHMYHNVAAPGCTGGGGQGGGAGASVGNGGQGGGGGAGGSGSPAIAYSAGDACFKLYTGYGGGNTDGNYAEGSNMGEGGKEFTYRDSALGNYYQHPVRNFGGAGGANGIHVHTFDKDGWCIECAKAELLIEDGVLLEYNGFGGEVVIPEGVTKIADNVFNGNKAVSGIVFPSTLEEIGSSAFQGTLLTSIDIPDSVKAISDNAFKDCAGLRNVTVHWAEADKIVTPPNGAFDGIASDCLLSVPTGTAQLYKNNAVWGKFSLISDTMLYMAYDTEAKKFVQKTTPSAPTVLTSTDESVALTNEWYAVDGEVTVGERITVSGNVNLILKDGCKLTLKEGLEVSAHGSLTIYGQTEETGEFITPRVSDNTAAIGLSDFAELNIHGGKIEVRGGNYAAGIGGYQADSGTVTVYGGSVTAHGYSGGAGIGCYSFTVYGGKVSAYGDNSAAISGNVTVNGGEVDVNNTVGGTDSKVVINDGKVTVTGDKGVVGGNNSSVEINGGDIKVSNNITIGVDCYTGHDAEITIRGGNIDAFCYYYPAIGGNTNGVNVNIYGGSIKAKSNSADGAIVAKSVTVYPGKCERFTVKDSSGNELTGSPVTAETDISGIISENKQIEINPVTVHVYTGDYVDNNNGTHSRFCACGESLGEPENHTFENHTCVCGAKNNHSFTGDYVNNGDGTHSRKCIECGEYGNPEAHTYINGVCVCGRKESTEKYFVRSWDEDNKKVVSTEADTPANAKEIVSDTTELDGGWYYVAQSIQISDRIIVKGTAENPTNIILPDGVTLFAMDGIEVAEGYVLNIYGQANDTGKIDAQGKELTTTAIGSNGTVTIFGGTVTAKAAEGADGAGICGTVTVYGGAVTASSAGGAGIGGCYGDNGGSVTVYGGTVTATSELGAGIGGGRSAKGNGSNGGNVTVYGGVVTASSLQGAGIGGGGGDLIIGKGGDGGSFTIAGGIVTATSTYGAGIGGAYNSTEHGDFITYEMFNGLTISTGKYETEAVEVSAKQYRTERSSYVHIITTHAHIDADKDGWCDICGRFFFGKYVVRSWDEDNKKVVSTEADTPANAKEIVSDTTELSGGWYFVPENVEISDRIIVKGTAENPTNIILPDGVTLFASAGIEVAEGYVLNIYGQEEDTGKIIAQDNFSNAAIGGSYRKSGGTVTVFGGTVTASSEHGAGIGGGEGVSVGGKGGDGGNVTVYGGTVTATSRLGSGIGGGFGDTISGKGGDGGNVTVYGGTVTASSEHGAGIGGGEGEFLKGKGGDGGNVTVYGGTVTATSRQGAGIGGGGYNGNGGSFTIAGGIVTASSEHGAGIGGGYNGNGGSFTITGGTVIATSTNGTPIGAGFGGTDDGVMFFKGGTVTTGIHEHTYSDKWSYNETHHWHDATCEHSNITFDLAEHTFNKTEDSFGNISYVCSECGYSASADKKAAKITLSSNKEVVLIGDTVTLTATVLPDTAENKSVKWTSLDTNIATVADGVVTAKCAGSTVIIAETVDGGYKDFCLIRVAGITPKLNTTAVVDYDNGIISGIAPKLGNLDSFIETSEDGLTLTYSSDTIGTGTTVNVLRNGEVVDAYTTVLFGDVNNDGVYDGMDAMIVNCLANGMLTREQVGEAVYMAADCNHDGVIDSNDVDILQQAGVLLASVDQSKSQGELQTDSAYVEYLNLIDQNPVNEETQPEQTPSALDKLIGFIADIYAFLNNLINFIKTIFA